MAFVYFIKPAPSYTLSRSATSVNEPGAFTITLTTTGVPTNTLVPYTITGVSSADISGAPLTGNFTVNNGVSQLSVTVTADALTEGLEVFTLSLAGSLGSITVNVNDTSFPSYQTIEYIRSATLQSGAGMSNSLSVATSPGDVVVAMVVAGDGLQIGIGAGWTSVVTNAKSNDLAQRIAYRVATGTSVGLGTWQYGSSAALMVFRGVDTVTPLVNKYVWQQIGTFNHPAQSGFQTNSMMLATGSRRSATTLSGQPLNNGASTLVNISSNPYAAQFTVLASSGTTNPPVWNANTHYVASGTCFAGLFELRAAPTV